MDRNQPTMATSSTTPATRTACGTRAFGSLRHALTRATMRASSKYATGTTTRVSSVEVIRPPMVAIEIGARKSLPSPRPMADGSMPRIMAMVVIRMGRRRIGPAFSTASFTLMPSRTYWLVRSTSRIAFLVTSPINITTPIMAGMPRFLPVSRMASSAPTSASGNEIMIRKGSRNDSNCEASTI